MVVFWELREIAAGEFAGDVLFLGRIDKSDAGSFESGPAETSSIDPREGAHDFIDSDKFRTSTLVVVDTGLTTVETEFTEEFEIACFPSRDALTNASVFRIEMFGTTGKTLRHGDARLLVGGLGNVAEEGLVERFQRLVGIG